MTSAIDSNTRGIPAPILWITGLSGTGKTTLAHAVWEVLRGDGFRPLLLDGDQVRNALEPDILISDHAPQRREKRAWRIARLARLAAEQGVPVVVATISLLHSVQAWNRKGSAPYAEIFLHADFAALRQRKPALYSTGAKNVVGLDIVPEFPRHPDLVLHQSFDSDNLTLHRDAVLQIWHKLVPAQGAVA